MPPRPGRFLRATLAIVVAAGFGVYGQPSLAARPQACPGGRFLVVPADAPLVTSIDAHPPDAVVIGDPIKISIPKCGFVTATLKAAKHFTTVKGKWPECGALRNVRLTAKIVSPGCTELRGKLRTGRKKKAESFLALRSACGDEQVDQDIGEVCDTTALNGDLACPGLCIPPGAINACQCSVSPTTTTTTTSTTATTATLVTTTTRRTSTTTSTSTTTTTTGPTTTSTTLGTSELPVAGKKLRVVSRGTRQKLLVVIKDGGIQKGEAGDPPGLSGSAEVVYAGNASNAAVFTLPADGWIVNKDTLAKYVNKGSPAGGGIKSVVIRVGKLLKFVARNLGDSSQLSIASPPGPSGVTVIVTLFNANDGLTQKLCTNFPSVTRSSSTRLVMTNGVPFECSGPFVPTTTTTLPPIVTCDPLAQTCPSGQGCYVLTDTGTCEHVTGAGGGNIPGTECTAPTDCQPGSACVLQTSVLSICRSYCNFAVYPNVFDPGHCPASAPTAKCRSFRSSPTVGVCIP